MKTLQELQQEVRVLEDHLRGLGNQLGQVAASLDELQHAGGDTGIDFDAVRFCAEKLEFKSHPLAELPSATAQLYLTALLSLARFRTELDGNLLIFAQWILRQTKLENSLSSLLLAGYDFGEQQIRELHRQLGTNWAPMLLLDLLVGAGISGPPDEKALEYIGELALMFQLEEDTVKQIAAAARCSLRQSLEGEKKKKLVDLPGYAKIYWTKEMCNKIFVKEVSTTTASVLKTVGKALTSAAWRSIVVEEPKGYGKEISWLVRQEETVRPDTEIALIQEWNASNSSYRSRMISVGYFGKLFQIERNNVVYGIVSTNSNDTLDEVTRWLEKQKGGAV